MNKLTEFAQKGAVISPNKSTGSPFVATDDGNFGASCVLGDILIGIKGAVPTDWDSYGTGYTVRVIRELSGVDLRQLISITVVYPDGYERKYHGWASDVLYEVNDNHQHPVSKEQMLNIVEQVAHALSL